MVVRPVVQHPSSGVLGTHPSRGHSRLGPGSVGEGESSGRESAGPGPLDHARVLGRGPVDGTVRISFLQSTALQEGELPHFGTLPTLKV